MSEPNQKSEDYIGCKIPKSEMSAQGGCQCKVDGVTLNRILSGADEIVSGNRQKQGSALTSPPLQPEDCGFYDLPGGTYLFTVDINQVIGTDMIIGGRVGAMHAFSDVYACFGIPLVASVILEVKREHGVAVAEALEAGVLGACIAEGVTVVNGQTLYSTETKIGLSVVGKLIAPQPLRKTGAREGDLLFLSKPLGTGLLTRAFTLDVISEEEFDDALRVMMVSNREAMFAALDAEARAGTDVTGFGFLGHLSEMLTGGLGAEIYARDLPVIERAAHLPDAIGQTHWIDKNLEYASERCGVKITAETKLDILLDPQTNGPLLVAASPDKADVLIGAGYVLVGQINTNGGEIVIR